jgi:hypothetical protein
MNDKPWAEMWLQYWTVIKSHTDGCQHEWRNVGARDDRPGYRKCKKCKYPESTIVRIEPNIAEAKLALY